MPETDGLPDVTGLADFVRANSDIQEKGGSEDNRPTQETQAQNATPVVPEGQVDVDAEIAGVIKPFLNPDGKVRTKDVLKSYKEILGKTTQVSQENKQLREQLGQMQEFLEIQKLQQVPQQQAQQQPKKFDEQFIENPEQAVEFTVERKLQTARVADVLEQEESKNPTEFQERYAYAMRLRQYYPQLVASPAGVRKLFELGDRYRQQDMRKNAERSIRLLLGDDADIEKFKALVAKDKQNPGQPNNNNAYMPDTSSGIRPDTGKTQNANDTRISDAAQKGDVDSVISGIFKKHLTTG